MKISNSKKQLAKIISENGGWREGAKFAAQDQEHCGKQKVISFYINEKPWFRGGTFWRGNGVHGDRIETGELVRGWHQTILSRDEYFHLYPAPDVELVAMCADVTKENKHPEYCESVMRSIPEPSDKPTIEQLAADYRAKLAIAQQAQEEADSHRCGAEAALKLLELAGAELGLVIAVCETPKQDQKLNITDWRDLLPGDEIECIGDNWDPSAKGRVNIVMGIEDPEYTGSMNIEIYSCWGSGFKFIRRP